MSREADTAAAKGVVGAVVAAFDEAGRHELCLYVTGRTTHTQRALANLRAVLDTALSGRYTLDVVDVLEEPGRATAEKILATPTLVRRGPPPTRRIIGDFSDRARVLHGLDLALPSVPG